MIGEILGFIMARNSVFGSQSHHWISLFVIVGGALQGYFGYLTNKYPLDVQVARMHRAGGYFLLAVSFIQIWTGLYLYAINYLLDPRIIPTFFSLAMAGIVSVQLSAESLGKQELTDALSKELGKLAGKKPAAAAAAKAAPAKKASDAEDDDGGAAKKLLGASGKGEGAALLRAKEMAQGSFEGQEAWENGSSAAASSELAWPAGPPGGYGNMCALR